MGQNGDKIFINSEQLVAIANSIKSKKEQIMSIYNSEVVTALKSSENCLSVAGLDYASIINAFNNIYTEMDKRITNLADALSTKIAPNYDAMAVSIRNAFNSDFASEMQSLVARMNASTRIGGAVKPAEPIIEPKPVDRVWRQS